MILEYFIVTPGVAVFVIVVDDDVLVVTVTCQVVEARTISK